MCLEYFRKTGVDVSPVFREKLAVAGSDHKLFPSEVNAMICLWMELYAEMQGHKSASPEALFALVRENRWNIR